MRVPSSNRCGRKINTNPPSQRSKIIWGRIAVSELDKRGRRSDHVRDDEARTQEVLERASERNRPHMS